MLPFEFYQIVADPSNLSNPVRYESHESLFAAIRAVPAWLTSSCKVYIYRVIVPKIGSISRKFVSSYESE